MKLTKFLLIKSVCLLVVLLFSGFFVSKANAACSSEPVCSVVNANSDNYVFFRATSISKEGYATDGTPVTVNVSISNIDPDCPENSDLRMAVFKHHWPTGPERTVYPKTWFAENYFTKGGYVKITEFAVPGNGVYQFPLDLVGWQAGELTQTSMYLYRYSTGRKVGRRNLPVCSCQTGSGGTSKTYPNQADRCNDSFPGCFYGANIYDTCKTYSAVCALPSGKPIRPWIRTSSAFDTKPTLSFHYYENYDFPFTYIAAQAAYDIQLFDSNGTLIGDTGEQLTPRYHGFKRSHSWNENWLFRPESLTSGQSYCWRVEVRSSCSAFPNWSPLGCFSVPALPPTPTPTPTPTPAGPPPVPTGSCFELEKSGLNTRWAWAPTGTDIRVKVYDSNGTVWYDNKVSARSSATYTLVGANDNRTIYGITSIDGVNWSAPGELNLPCFSPTPTPFCPLPSNPTVSPGGSITDTAPDFSFAYNGNGGEKQAAYQIQLFDAIGNLLGYTGEQLGGSTTHLWEDGWTLRPASLSAGQSYCWRVETRSSCSAFPNWSPLRCFSLPAPTVTPLPTATPTPLPTPTPTPPPTPVPTATPLPTSAPFIKVYDADIHSQQGIYLPTPLPALGKLIDRQIGSEGIASSHNNPPPSGLSQTDWSSQTNWPMFDNAYIPYALLKQKIPQNKDPDGNPITYTDYCPAGSLGSACISSVSGYFLLDTDLTISNLNISAGQKLIILLADNNVTITDNITVNDRGFFMIATDNGDITIDPAVSQIQGLYYSAQGTFSTGEGSNPLDLTGVFVAYSFNLQRDLGPANSSQPAETFRYQPSLLFSAPPFLMTRYTLWEQVAP